MESTQIKYPSFPNKGEQAMSPSTILLANKENENQNNSSSYRTNITITTNH